MGNSSQMSFKPDCRAAGRLFSLAACLALLVPLFMALSQPAGVMAQDDEEVEPATYWDANLGVEIPGALGQLESHVWVSETGHSIRGYMLDYWRALGSSSMYGNPVSEPFPARNGFYSQAFESSVFQFRPEYLWTETPSVTLMPIGKEILENRSGDVRRDGKRQGGGGDRRTPAWRSYGTDSGVAQRASERGDIFDAESGHSITGEFKDWYGNMDGEWFLGRPLSQPVVERGVVAQYFEGAVLMRSGSGKVSALPIVREQASRFGIDTRPVDQGGLPEFSETLLWTAENPNPLGDPSAPGRKWIEISLSEQTLWAYQGNTLISSTLVSTGLDPNGTEVGEFYIRYKRELQDMAGAVNANGEVVALGQEAANEADTGITADQSSYAVEDVPDVMYFNLEAEALHGAYWHNNFGTKMSHGCVNLPLYFADWLYGWAPLGTLVWVHE